MMFLLVIRQAEITEPEGNENFVTDVSDEFSEMLEKEDKLDLTKHLKRVIKVKCSTDQQILIASKGTTVARIRYI